MTSVGKPASEPTFNGGIMFSSGNELVTYGGFYPPWNDSASGALQPNSSTSTMRSFDISTGQWRAINGPLGLAGGAGASAPGTGKAWYLGGVQNGWTTQGLQWQLAVEGMLEFSGTSFANLTTTFSGLFGAMMAHVPRVGEKGILVKIGGQSYIPGIANSRHGMVVPLSSPPHPSGKLSVPKTRYRWRRSRSTTSHLGFGTTKPPRATRILKMVTQRVSQHLACKAARWPPPRPTTQVTTSTCLVGSSKAMHWTRYGCSHSPCSAGRKSTGT